MALNTPQCDTAAREADVAVAADRIRGSLERLDETVTRLTLRLEPVLGPEAAVTPGDAIAPTLGNCAVSAEMYSASQRMDSYTYRLRDLLDRLEV